MSEEESEDASSDSDQEMTVTEESCHSTRSIEVERPGKACLFNQVSVFPAIDLFQPSLSEPSKPVDEDVSLLKQFL